MIITFVLDSLLLHILSIIYPRIVWLKLGELYESKSINSRLTLKSKLYSLKFSKKSIIDQHLKVLTTLVV
jgi:hypothetical protein